MIFFSYSFPLFLIKFPKIFQTSLALIFFDRNREPEILKIFFVFLFPIWSLDNFDFYSKRLQFDLSMCLIRFLRLISCRFRNEWINMFNLFNKRPRNVKGSNWSNLFPLDKMTFDLDNLIVVAEAKGIKLKVNIRQRYIQTRLQKTSKFYWIFWKISFFIAPFFSL